MALILELTSSDPQTGFRIAFNILLSLTLNHQRLLISTLLYGFTTYNGGFVQEIDLWFTSDSVYRNSSAVVKIRYYDESLASEWEVYLGGLPNDNQGREVTVNWKSYDINNNQTFYTDSNGLEMQKRILNYRPSFNFSSFEQVSGNYYPVNSAIAIVDETKQLQMAVLNDRSQGGSVV